MVHDQTVRIVQLAQHEIAFDSNSRQNCSSSAFQMVAFEMNVATKFVVFH